jgi:RNA polymerase sigma-54 factor
MEWVECNGNGMREDLLQQAKFSFNGANDLQLLEYLIYNLDDNGYLHLSEDSTSFLELDESAIINGIHLLQQIGPIGIGARNLKECLLLQITYKYPEELLAKNLIQNHFDLLGNRRWDEIATLMKISLAEVKNLHEFIKKLNPKPCAAIADYTTEYVTPDIVVKYKNEELSYYLNDRYLPFIQLNNEYLPFKNGNSETAKYVTNQFNSYQWLLSSIEKRRITISKIVEVILTRQESFFNEGFIALQPLTLKEVADEIEMHESTVSRAVANKTIQTPNGTFDFRMLFTSKLETNSGETISQTKVKALLELFIAEENKQKPVSDQKIANYLNTEKGIEISRRTISKYREELNIPSSRMRKEIK